MRNVHSRPAALALVVALAAAGCDRSIDFPPGTGEWNPAPVPAFASERREAVVDRSPGDVILTRDGATAYVSHFDVLRFMNALDMKLPEEQGWSTIAIVDTRTMARPALHPVCATMHGMVLSPDEKTVY